MGENHQQQQQQQQQEDQDRGQPPRLRSINNYQKSFVKFINKTTRNVALYWINYRGRAIKYGVLLPGDFLDINTFVTHPWIFVDDETNDRRREDSGRPRTNVYITLPLYTLREMSLRVIGRCITRIEQVFQLDIPRSLQYELKEMLFVASEESEGQIHPRVDRGSTVNGHNNLPPPQ
ncbi:von Hippel-Lindau disease tumor suppressor isoform X2 [Colletes gigas]|uniref:von Hippel-Lindau disease tumor suppressor isoform X2 n=1 Tax=Colletes gigas TaxID=935657 RepID=UPI001C9B5E68|nr:von Hippel-Lindau disease tumor suppressor isoform X2 [Colletes gigas]